MFNVFMFNASICLLDAGWPIHPTHLLYHAPHLGTIYSTTPVGRGLRDMSPVPDPPKGPVRPVSPCRHPPFYFNKKRNGDTHFSFFIFYKIRSNVAGDMWWRHQAKERRGLWNMSPFSHICRRLSRWRHQKSSSGLPASPSLAMATLGSK
jgi:hypothetical protein